MKFLKEYLRKIWKVPALFLLFAVIMSTVFSLYNLPLEPVLYGAVLCAIAGGASFLYGYVSYRKRRKKQIEIEENLPLNLENLSRFFPPQDGTEVQYQQMIESLNRMRMDAESARQRFYTDLTDYYTLWVHQIKTPISAMRLLLCEDTAQNNASLAELFKIEQYVEMVLGYLRTEDMSSDMNFQHCSLDKIIREQIHKYARIFIGKKISLEYNGTEEIVLTDPKWLGFVIGQILSNALKYTKTGKISIYISQNHSSQTLVIEDTGIGIRREDLPRVFEKGFTGCNGREESHSTGIGLYLSAKIMKRLGHRISIESTEGEGTRVLLSLTHDTLDIE